MMTHQIQKSGNGVQESGFRFTHQKAKEQWKEKG